MKYAVVVRWGMHGGQAPTHMRCQKGLDAAIGLVVPYFEAECGEMDEIIDCCQLFHLRGFRADFACGRLAGSTHRLHMCCTWLVLLVAFVASVASTVTRYLPGSHQSDLGSHPCLECLLARLRDFITEGLQAEAGGPARHMYLAQHALEPSCGLLEDIGMPAVLEGVSLQRYTHQVSSSPLHA